MDAGEWFRWAAAFVLGALSTVLVEFGRGQVERRQRKQDRRDDLCQVKMVELLKPSHTLPELLHQFWYPRFTQYWDHGEWSYSPDTVSHLTAA